MKFAAISVLNFFGIWCGVKPSSVTVVGPRGARYRILDAKINEHGDITIEVKHVEGLAAALAPNGMTLEEVSAEKVDTDGFALGTLRMV